MLSKTVVCATLLFVCVRAQQEHAPPPLPRISYAELSQEIRAQLRKAEAEVRARPRDGQANGRLGMALHAYEQYDFAAVCYQRAARFAPGEFRWRYYWGQVLSALGKSAEAVSAFKSALPLQPNDPPARLRLADALVAAGRHDESRAIYDELANRPATAPQAQYGLGQIELARGDKIAGIARFRGAIAGFPEYGAAHYALGLALRDQGQLEDAQKHLALSRRFAGQRPPLDDPLLDAVAGLNRSATQQLQRGVALAGMGRLEAAIDAHEQALALNARLTQAHINLISLYARAGQDEKAEQHYQAAVADNPNLADSHFNYGVLLLGRGRHAEAAAAFRRSLERNPFRADTHYNYAAIVEREGRLDEAAAHFRHALENQPDHRQAHFHLARILVNQEQYADAIRHFRQTIAVDDEDTPRFLYALAATHARAGEKQKAIEHLRDAQRRAAARGQAELLAAITRDLQMLEGTK
jgi:tetratricopeptide (TPR) repeat protein